MRAAVRIFLTILVAAITVISRVVHDGSVCTVSPESLSDSDGGGKDDTPSIARAFDLCGQDGSVIISNGTFHINSALNTTNLRNCDISLRGELRFSKNLTYWKNNGFPVIAESRTTAWLFGGTNVTLRGEEGGWYNGNGQTWYTQNRNKANGAGRPISITFFNSTNLWVDRLSIVQPQFWATYVWQSKNVSLTNFYSNATSNDQWNVVNTDGFDSFHSDGIRIENASITTRDDCIAAKGNTTNLYVRNVTCHWTACMTIGSIGQYLGKQEYVQNVTFEDVRCLRSRNGAYIKTWPGPPDEGQEQKSRISGGGFGLVKNITFKNFEMDDVGMPIYLSQCIYNDKSCGTSEMQVEDVMWENIRGTSKFNIAASLSCSETMPCRNIRFENVSIESINSTLGLKNYETTIQHQVYQCANIMDEGGSGIPCNRKAPNNFPQHPTANLRGNPSSSPSPSPSSSPSPSGAGRLRPPGFGWLRWLRGLRM